ncbi:MAG: LemA family protein [Desulfobacterales bacterium]
MFSLKRRYDLIPNLAEVVKKYMQHERETLEAVIQARNSAVSASNQASEPRRSGGHGKTWSASEGLLSGALGRLLPCRKLSGFKGQPEYGPAAGRASQRKTGSPSPARLSTTRS